MNLVTEQSFQQAFNPPLKPGGYTLLELIITVAMLSILLATATPSFASMIQKNKVRAASNNLVQSLHLARSHAINEAHTVLVCPLAKPYDGKNAAACIGKPQRNQNWQYGWLVYTDLNANNEFDPEDKLIVQQKADATTAVVFNQNGRLRFFANGSARSAGFYICQQESDRITHIKLLHSGRARITHSNDKKRLSTCKNTLGKGR